MQLNSEELGLILRRNHLNDRECNSRAAWGLVRLYYLFLFLLAILYYFIRTEIIYSIIKIRSNFKVFSTVI